MLKTKYIKYLLGLLLITIVIYLALPNKAGKIAVSKTTPSNKAINILPSDSITIEFSQEIGSNQQEQISYNINPSIPFSSNWTSSNTLTITPKDFLSEKATYTVTVNLNNNTIHTFSFQTKSTKDLTEEEEVIVLARGERLYSQSIKEDLEQNPWKAYFPIITNKYTLIYAPPKDAYVVDYLSDFSAEEISSIKSEIREKLKEIGAPEKKLLNFK